MPSFFPSAVFLGGSRFQSEVGDDSVVAEATADAEEILTDVCIVGAGPAGITIASELDKCGVRICLLEAGGREVERRFQRQSRGESDGYPIHRLHASRLRAFGGTLRHPSFTNGGWAARPLDPIDFEPREGRPEFGWPFQREHLDPYYTRAQSAYGVRRFDVAVTPWSQQMPSDARSIVSSPELEPAIFQFPKSAFHDCWEVLSVSSNVRLLLETRAVEIRRDVTGRRVDTRGAQPRLCARCRTLVELSPRLPIDALLSDSMPRGWVYFPFNFGGFRECDNVGGLAILPPAILWCSRQRCGCRLRQWGPSVNSWARQ
jgi:FAD binding domain